MTQKDFAQKVAAELLMTQKEAAMVIRKVFEKIAADLEGAIILILSPVTSFFGIILFFILK